MKFVCLFNPDTKEIQSEIEIADDEAASEFNRYATEAMNRGNNWGAYCGNKPFEFPEEKKEPEKEN